jgi:16S rRNA processing protein RimM
MIDPSEYVEIGYLRKLFGVDGSFVLSLKIKQTKDFLKEEESIFLKIEENLIPFFMDYIDAGDYREPVIHIDTILDRDEGQKYVGLSCYYHKKMLEGFSATLSIDTLIGYSFHDAKTSYNGVIEAYVDVPGNPLIEVNIEGKIVLIPLIDEFVLSINTNTKTIESDYPEGLIESLLDD